MTNVYFLNNSGSRWIVLENGKKVKCEFNLANGETVKRTVIEFRQFGNFVTCLISWKGKKISVFSDSVLHPSLPMTKDTFERDNQSECLIDSAFGVYIPKVFFERDYFEQFGLNKSDFLELQDIEHPDYWDVWQDVLDKAETIDGKILHQDADLFVIHPSYNFENGEFEY